MLWPCTAGSIFQTSSSFSIILSTFLNKKRLPIHGSVAGCGKVEAFDKLLLERHICGKIHHRNPGCQRPCLLPALFVAQGHDGTGSCGIADHLNPGRIKVGKHAQGQHIFLAQVGAKNSGDKNPCGTFNTGRLTEKLNTGDQCGLTQLNSPDILLGDGDVMPA